MRKKHRVNYDVLASNYNQRYDNDEGQNRAAPLIELTKIYPSARVLEAGCGTGYWLSNLGLFPHKLCGLDLSAGMLQLAQKRQPDLLLTRGTASHLPFHNRLFHLVYCINAIHHFVDPQAFISDAFRILVPGGTLAVAGMEPHGKRESWYIYDYFPGTYEADINRFPRWETVSDWMNGAGFEKISRSPFEYISDPKIGKQVLEDPFLQKDQSSQLAILSDEEYELGVERIRRALEEAERERTQLVFNVEIEVDMVTCIKPGSE